MKSTFGASRVGVGSSSANSESVETSVAEFSLLDDSELLSSDRIWKQRKVVNVEI